jgi:hypothetical protein
MKHFRWKFVGCLVVSACGSSSNTPGFGTGASGSLSGGSAEGGSGNEAGGGSGSGSMGSTGSPAGALDAATGDGDAGDDGGLDAGSGGVSDSGAGGPTPPASFVPKATQPCPAMKTGNVTFSGQQWQLWAGTPTAAQHGALLLYWHGTGSTSAEPTYTIGQAQIDAITAEGGLVASASTTTATGTNTGNGVWYTGDFDMADQVVACAIDQLHVDPRRIHSSGASAGGLEAVWMAYARSGYIASIAPLSGGITRAPALQDPNNVPSAMVIHGAMGKDVVVIDFAQASAAYEADIKAKGGFSIDCNTGGGHVSGPPQISPSIWQFLKAHPYKVSPEPYAGGLPAGFPSYCKIP